MPYSPATSYSYTPLSIAQIQAGAGQIPQQGMDFAKWATTQGLDLANAVRGDRNAQFAVQAAYQQQQADRALAQQQFANQLQKQREAQAMADARQAAYNNRFATALELGRGVQEAVGARMPQAPTIARWDVTSGYVPDQAKTAQYLQDLLSQGYGIQSGVYGRSPKTRGGSIVNDGGFAYSPI